MNYFLKSSSLRICWRFLHLRIWHRTCPPPGADTPGLFRHTVLVGDRNDAFQSLLAFHGNHRPRENSMASWHHSMFSCSLNGIDQQQLTLKTKQKFVAVPLSYCLICLAVMTSSYHTFQLMNPSLMQFIGTCCNTKHSDFRSYSSYSSFRFAVYWIFLIASGQHPPDNRRPFCLGLGGLRSVKSTHVYATHFLPEFSAQASICGIPSTRDVGTHSGWWCIAKWVLVLDLALYSEWIAATLDDAPWSSHKVLKLVKENTQIRFWGCHGHCF